MVGTPAWWRSKCRSAGVTIPQKSCSGESEMPCPLPLGIRRGRSNVERWPRALVGWPGTLVGSGGAARAGAWASPARRSVCAPSAPAAPAGSQLGSVKTSAVVLGMLVPAVAWQGAPFHHTTLLLGQQPSACRACHQKVFATFVQTAHFRTSAEATARTVKARFYEGHN